MKVLNKYMLIALNPKSTVDELSSNSHNAEDALRIAINTYNDYFDINEDCYKMCDRDNAFDAIAIARIVFYVASNSVGASCLKQCLNKYFESAEDDIKDYHDEIKLINKDK